MEKTVNATLHNLVDFATDKLFSNPTVEHAKEKFYDTKDRFYDAKDKYTSKFSKKSNNTNNALLYTGLAIAAAGAAYLIYKNREAIKEQILSAVDKIKDVQEQYMNQQQPEDNSRA
ncbi:MAG: hypothetical protein JWM14_2235 [Chitinophagaceae bacterium]|nr:hypothetical protein [Chitinophagaceae bacterium]